MMSPSTSASDVLGEGDVNFAMDIGPKLLESLVEQDAEHGSKEMCGSEGGSLL